MAKLSRVFLGGILVFSGINHFLMPDFYLDMMPPFLPFPLALIYFSGIIEFLFGGMLQIEKTRRLVSLGVIFLFAAIFPANIYMAMTPQNFPNVPVVLSYLRLPMQFILMYWAYTIFRSSLPGREIA